MDVRHPLASLLMVVLGSCQGDGESSAVRHDMPTPVDELRTVWSFADDDVWVGGHSVFHFDGERWTEVATPQGEFVTAFWGFAPDDLWATTGTGVMRWNGAVWEPLLSGLSAPARLGAIWGDSPADVWVAGEREIGGHTNAMHWNGTEWEPHGIPDESGVVGLWGSSGDDVWAAGRWQVSHYDGATWSEVLELETLSGGHAVHGFAPDDVWILSGGSYAHYDGAEWSIEPELYGSANVWGRSSTDLWGATSSHVSHSDGTRWTIVHEASSTLTFGRLHGSPGESVWVVGEDTGTGAGFVLELR